ncbi:MAG: ribosome biogenesis GTP-binding protein YihA/YsxC [Bacteriovoracaceae bacterium]|jgi:GTP-binding protein|nr:ribosome biogenesis GTP-binding protein YihA/YsxC [Bacteriovoracaceae bacterium]
MEQSLIKRKSATFLMAIDDPKQMKSWFENHQDAIGVAMVGRSNVGKSTLINSLFGNKTAKTSKTPGRTQKVNIFKFCLEENEEKWFYLYDLPGYGFAQVSKSMQKNWRDLMGTFFTQMSPTTLLFNLQDARNPNQRSDQEFYEYLTVERLEVFLIFNKIDKLKKQKEKAALNKLKPKIFETFKKVKQIFFISAEKKDGTAPLEAALVNYLHKMDAATSFEADPS